MEHLTSEELSAFLANSLNAQEREVIERHLVVCAECRTEVIEGQRAIASAPSAKKADRGRFYIAGLAAAAAIAVAFWPTTDFSHSSAPVERSASTQTRTDAGSVSIVSPAAESQIDAAAMPTFVWKGNDGASYKITVTDAAGRPLWTHTTSDTSITLPASVQLPRGEQYFWYVDALRSDGRSITSGINSFRTPR